MARLTAADGTAMSGGRRGCGHRWCITRRTEGHARKKYARGPHAASVLGGGGAIGRSRKVSEKRCADPRSWPPSVATGLRTFSNWGKHTALGCGGGGAGEKLGKISVNGGGGGGGGHRWVTPPPLLFIVPLVIAGTATAIGVGATRPLVPGRAKRRLSIRREGGLEDGGKSYGDLYRRGVALGRAGNFEKWRRHSPLSPRRKCRS